MDRVGRRRDVAHQRGDLVFVEVETGEDRVEVAQEGIERAQQDGEVVAEELAQRPGSRSARGRSPVPALRRSPSPAARGWRRRSASARAASAAGTSWRNSGSVLSANSLSRSKVSLDSSWKVGKARNSASMSRSRAAVVLKTALELRIRSASWPSRPRRAWRATAPLLNSCWTASRCVSSTRKSLSNSVKNGSSSASALEKRLALAVDRDRAFLHPFLEGGAGARVEGAEDLVELDRFGDVGARPACRRRAARARRRRRGSVRRRSRRAASWCAGSPACPCGIGAYLSSMSIVASACWPSGDCFDVLHFADRDAGDPHVGLLGELGRLVEGDLDLVGLRLERRRAAEGDPEEEQDAEAGQGEAGDDEELRGAGGSLAHCFGPHSQWSGRVFGIAGILRAGDAQRLRGGPQVRLAAIGCCRRDA